MRASLSSVFGLVLLSGCGGRFDDFAEISPFPNVQAAFVFTPSDDARSRLLLINLDGEETPCEGRSLDATFTTACVLYDASDVLPGSLSTFSLDATQTTFSAIRGNDIEVFITALAAPVDACASGEAPIGGACNASLNLAGDDLTPVFGVSPSGIEAALFLGNFAQDTDQDGALDTVLPDLASSGVAPLQLTFASRLVENDLASIPSQPTVDRQNRRVLLSIADGNDDGIFFLNLNGLPSGACDPEDAVLGACPLVDSALIELGAVSQPITNRLYILRQDGDETHLAFTNADGSDPEECPAPTTAAEGACVVVAAAGLPTFSDDGRFLIFPEADPEEAGETRLRLVTLNGETPAACLAPFALSGEACVLDAQGGSLSTQGFVPVQ